VSEVIVYHDAVRLAGNPFKMTLKSLFASPVFGMIFILILKISQLPLTVTSSQYDTLSSLLIEIELLIKSAFVDQILIQNIRELIRVKIIFFIVVNY
jgi:hypothetical protein